MTSTDQVPLAGSLLLRDKASASAAEGCGLEVGHDRNPPLHTGIRYPQGAHVPCRGNLGVCSTTVAHQSGSEGFYQRGGSLQCGPVDDPCRYLLTSFG